VRIRSAVIDDCHGIAVVHVTAWQVAYRGIVADEVLDAMDVGAREERWRSGWHDNPLTQRWVAEDGEVAGWSIAGPTRDDDAGATPGELFGIYVAPEHWGTGVGQGLFETGVAWLERHFVSSSLWTLRENARARRFYERNGWTPDGATKRSEARGFPLDEVRYVSRVRQSRA
jgi:GNAT superfamily N-acetyltransferase